jgi:RNA polymerase sigma factor (TIGR02999 family)
VAEITQILQRLSTGDQTAIEELTPLVYQQLRQIAQRQLTAENDARRWDATELVHEAYLRMIGDTPVGWKDRAHFFAAAATSIRRVLVDNARKVKAQKRGGNAQPVNIDLAGFSRDELGCELLELDDALEQLKLLSERQAQIVELRFFGGLTQDEVAELLGISRGTVAGDWAMARAWLYRELKN